MGFSAESKIVEGVVLNVIPYASYDQIITLFTAESGVIKLFCRRGKAQWNRYDPLTKVEVTYREGKSELFSCDQIAVLHSYLHLRGNLIHLQTGCDMIQSIYKSQMGGKEAPLLYKLLIYYLDRISDVGDPKILSSSFKLKILRHEGLLNLEVPSMLEEFNEQEREMLKILAYEQNYRDLCQLRLMDELKGKIDHFFIRKINE